MSAPTVPVPGAPPPSGGGWWRRNRWALAALPVALALALVASGDRVRTLWWEQDLRRPTSAAPGEALTFRQDVLDGLGGSSRIDVQVRLADVDEIDDLADLPEGMMLPVGARAVRVDLSLGADPDVVLMTCRLAVRDVDGTRYDYVSAAWGATQPAAPCVPPGAAGPRPSLGEHLDARLSPSDDAPRPRTWTVSPVIVLPQDVEVADVVLWWQMPQYVRLEVRGS